MSESDSDYSQETFPERFQLKRLIKENHSQQIIDIKIYKNLVATVSPTQLNLYDNSHLGTNLDIMSQYNSQNTLSCCAFFKEMLIVGSAFGLHFLSICQSQEISKYPCGNVLDISCWNDFIFVCCQDNLFVFKDSNLQKSLKLEFTRICCVPEGLVCGDYQGAIHFFKIDYENLAFDSIYSRSIVNSYIDSIVSCDDKVLVKSKNGKIVFFDILKQVEVFKYSTRSNNTCRIGIFGDLFCVGTENGVCRIYSLLNGR
jgi:hypothetical protein